MKKLFKRLKFLLNFRKSVPFLLDFFTSKEIPKKKKLLSIGFLIAYIIIPTDVIPDFLVFFGILDDVAIFSFILQQIINMAPQELKDKHKIEK